jgi:hypothetical protein
MLWDGRWGSDRQRGAEQASEGRSGNANAGAGAGAGGNLWGSGSIGQQRGRDLPRLIDCCSNRGQLNPCERN